MTLRPDFREGIEYNSSRNSYLMFSNPTPANSVTGQTKSSSTPPRAVFQAEGVTKVYTMGDVQVHALRGVDLWAEHKCHYAPSQATLTAPPPA